MSVRRTRNGTFEARVYTGVDPETGRELRLHRRAKTLEEALEMEEQLKRMAENAATESNGETKAAAAQHLPEDDYLNPAPPEVLSKAGGALTVAEFLADWLETSAKPNIKPRTFKRYREIVKLHICAAVGGVPLEKLGARDIARMLAAKRSGGSWRRAPACTSTAACTPRSTLPSNGICWAATPATRCPRPASCSTSRSCWSGATSPVFWMPTGPTGCTRCWWRPSSPACGWASSAR